MDSSVIELLDTEARRINTPDFIDDDPVQFPRRFSDIRDIEIVSFLVASIAWGNRKMILRDAEKMLRLMDGQPYHYTMEKGYEELSDNENIHRTFFMRDFKYFLRGLNEIYSHHETIDAFNSHLKNRMPDTPPAWVLVDAMNAVFSRVCDGTPSNRCLPLNTRTSALKRVNMALRWLVRNDGIVDMGVWKSIAPAQLYIPLDVHVGNVSRALGILNRKSNDRLAVMELTDNLRTIRPNDPTIYDFALFGLGVSGRAKEMFIGF